MAGPKGTQAAPASLPGDPATDGRGPPRASGWPTSGAAAHAVRVSGTRLLFPLARLRPRRQRQPLPSLARLY
jgi:hypothetical protein